MNLIKRRAMFAWHNSMTALLLALLVFGKVVAQTAAANKPVLSAEEQALTTKISVQTIKNFTAALSAKEMEGRGTMQPGGDRAANWIAGRFKEMGLKPLGDKDLYLQKIDFKETVFTPETNFQIGDEKLKFGSDYAFIPYSTDDKSASGEMYFIAYAIQARSINRDDLKGVDLAGKVVVMLDGPPANISKEDWDKQDAKWIFLANLVRSGVAGIVFIGHGREKDPPELMIDYLSRRQIALASEGSNSLPLPPVLIAGKNAAEKMFAKSGTTLKDALAQAESNSFKPIKLNLSAKITAKTKTTKGVSSNVVGYIEGSDAKLREEAVVFTAHYDAYGTDNGKIYYGAADNALGTSEMLAVAEAFSKMETKPKRSLIFLAVTGEEYGLYGSKFWAKNPTWNIKKIAANLNLDGVGTEVYGPVKTIVGYGGEHSTLGAVLQEVAGAMDIKVAPDPVPDEKIFYRSDHYSFVERGIPALMLMGTPEGDIQDTIKRMREWEKVSYHQPGDVIQDNWAWEGAKAVADVMGVMGWRIANAETMPSWLPTSRFAKLERGNTKELPPEK
jgi:hypothetical protein